mmetsp:Transcript_64813/g.115291  ORF Transcript_64813/g.115291 Transcript_64813/m.115291 type:complete len:228 (+) Transcript_64813:1392-2075(+)
MLLLLLELFPTQVCPALLLQEGLTPFFQDHVAHLLDLALPERRLLLRFLVLPLQLPRLFGLHLRLPLFEARVLLSASTEHGFVFLAFPLLLRLPFPSLLLQFRLPLLHLTEVLLLLFLRFLPLCSQLLIPLLLLLVHLFLVHQLLPQVGLVRCDDALQTRLFILHHGRLLLGLLRQLAVFFRHGGPLRDQYLELLLSTAFVVDEPHLGDRWVRALWHDQWAPDDLLR